MRHGVGRGLGAALALALAALAASTFAGAAAAALETHTGTLRLWRGDQHFREEAAVVAVDAPTQLFLSLASPRSLRPLPPGWGDGAEVEVVGRRISGSGLSWEFRADSLSVVKAAPPRRVFGGGGGGGGDISASAAAKPGLRVLYLRARFPRDCALAPGSARQTKATVQVARNIVLNASATLSACSFGRTSLSGAALVVTPLLPMTCAEARMDPCAMSTMLGWAHVMKQRAAKQLGLKLANFDIFNADYPDTATPSTRDPSCALSYGSRGNLGGNTIYDNYPASQPAHIFLHEMLHNLGLIHANSWDGAALPKRRGKDNYGDPLSIMGLAFALSCPNFPMMAQLLPKAFKPTQLAAPRSLAAGRFYRFTLAPDWVWPEFRNRRHATLKINVASLVGASGSGKSVWISYFMSESGPNRGVNSTDGTRVVAVRYTYQDAVETWNVGELGAGGLLMLGLTPANASAACANSNANCASWAVAGECGKNPAYMLTECRLACGVCSGATACEDSNNSCGFWAGTGECLKNPDYMLQQCKLSCHVCVPCTDSQCERKETPNSLLVLVDATTPSQASIQLCFSKTVGQCTSQL